MFAVVEAALKSGFTESSGFDLEGYWGELERRFLR